MKTFKPLFILTLLSVSLSSWAINLNCISKENTVAPTNKTDSDGNETQVWKDWKDKYSDWEVRQNWDCCTGLEKNASTRECVDKSLWDSTLKKCSNNSECSDGQGCYKLREDDMFIADDETMSSSELAAQQQKQADWEQQMSTLGDDDPKPNGDICFRNMECESYECKNMKCVENKICRLADKDEEAPGSIKCMDGYEKTGPTSICKDNSVPSFYAGNLGNINVERTPGGNQCQFDLYPDGKDLNGNLLTSEDLKNAINLGILTTRGMEWLFATTSLANHQDCLFTMRWMRDGDGNTPGMTKLVDMRKELLKAYNEDMIYIEEKFEKLKSVQQGDQNVYETSCVTNPEATATGGAPSFEMTTGHDIAMRRATGLDFLCYMRERNLLLREYEEAMLAHMDKFRKLSIDNYYNKSKDWGEKSKSWNIGSWSKEYKDQNCRNDWWPYWHKKIKRRWSLKYIVKGKAEENSGVVDKTLLVGKYLETMGSKDDFKQRKYFLIDPLMPGGYNQGVDFKAYGSPNFDIFDGKFERRLGPQGLINSFVSGGGLFLLGPVAGVYGLINYSLAEKNKTGLIGIHANFSKHLISFYKSLRKDGSDANFIYEPEIPGSYELRGCIDKMDDKSCEKFRLHIEKLKDVSMAQMMAYSRHTKQKYKDFFKNDNAWRNRLFKRIDVDLTNLTSYYKALSDKEKGYRVKQNACLDKQIAQLRGSEFSGEGTGVTVGTNNYYKPTTTNYLAGTGRDTNYNKAKLKKNNGKGGSFSLSAYNMSMKDNNGLKDGVSSSSSTGAGSVSDSGSGLAARIKEMDEANKAANTSSGGKLAAKEAEIRRAMASAANIGVSGSGSSAAAGNNASMSANSSLGKATLGDEEIKDAKSGASGGVAGGIAGGAGFGKSGMGSGNGLTGLVGGANSGSGSDSSGGSHSDPTGMSDEEKDIMAANYNRNKSKYDTKEDDTLFQVLSKTYVRNLDKILTRKKKLDDDSASYPSAPSTP